VTESEWLNVADATALWAFVRDKALFTRKHAAFLAGRAEEERVLCALIRDVIGNPFRPAPAVDPAWLAWNDGVVANLALAAYEEIRPPDHTLAPARLTALADALEDAGCTDAELLGHLRGPGPHVRGCWVVDLLLAKG
jgi:hypothetical protein